VSEPLGLVAQVVTAVKTYYREERDYEYDKVAILPDSV